MTAPGGDTAGLSPERLAEIAKRADSATPGPWVYEQLGIRAEATIDGSDTKHQVVDAAVAGKDAFGQHGRYVCGLACTRGKYEREEANGRFIAHARQDVPDLVAELSRLRALLREQKAQELIDYLRTSYSPRTCREHQIARRGLGCAECDQPFQSHLLKQAADLLSQLLAAPSTWGAR